MDKYKANESCPHCNRLEESADKSIKKVEECCCPEHNDKASESCCTEHSHKEIESCCAGHSHIEEECCCQSHSHLQSEQKQRNHSKPIKNKGWKLANSSQGSCCSFEDEHSDSCCSTDLHNHEETSCCSGGFNGKHQESSCECGCGGHIVEDTPSVTNGKLSRGTKMQLAKLLVSLVFLIVGFFDWKTISSGQGFLMAFYYVNPSWVAIILCGAPLFKGAYLSLKNKKLKVPVLVSVAILASIGLEIASFFIDMNASGHNHSYIFAAGEIAFLMSLGGWIESLTVKKCKSGIQRLVNLIPKEAFVKVGDTIEKRSLKNISIGDIVVCKSGEMIAVDGEIIKGSCSIDQSSVTGEYVPVDLTVGDKVFGGTMNVNGTVEILVQKLLKDMTVAKMAELVKEAEGKKAPIARVADKWVSLIIPSLIVLSPIVGLISYFALDAGVVESVVRAITILIVFCPCAFALATPTAIAAGLGNGAKNGVLIKSGESLEELSRINTVCFDKTGTLTEGKLLVSDINPYDITENELLKFAGSVEKYSEHPLSQAIVKKAENIHLDNVDDIKTISGVGISGTVQGKFVEIKSYKSTENELGFEQKNRASDLMQQGKTVVVVKIDGQIKGLLALSDTIRKGAKKLISNLKAKGYETVMLTGDHALSAQYVADMLGVDKVYSNLMPEDKMKAVKELQSQGKKVCMLGDGINDAPSLKLANVSIAMGAMSSDIAIDSANMAILNNDINKSNYTLNLGKRVMRTIKANIFIAMSVNIAALLLSLFGILNPVTGALLHNCTSIFVVLCSALLLFTPKKFKNITK